MNRTPRDKAIERGAGTNPPSHRVDLGGNFSLWRSICLRGAGFPIAMLEGLVAPETAASTENLFEAEEALQAALHEARNGVFDRIRPLDAAERACWRKAERLLRKRRVPEAPEGDPEAARLFGAVANRKRELDAAWERLAACFNEERKNWGTCLAGLKQQSLFKEAVLWQNHQALQQLPQSTGGIYEDSRKSRRQNNFLASHLQRYCTKNESIGFFGPLGSADLVDDGQTVTVTPGPRLVSRRRVFFEYWCIYALAKSMEALPELRKWLPPRIDPWLFRRDGILLGPDGRASRIPGEVDQLLKACDGRTTAKAIAEALTSPGRGGFRSEADVFRQLEDLEERKVIRWGFELPVTNEVERHMREVLDRIEDDGLRGRCLEQLDLLENKRGDIAVAAGQPDRLAIAMGELDKTFTALTNSSSTRHEGKMYAGRTLVYEDCWRDLELRFGPEWLEQLKPPLTLVLTSARWYSARISTVLRRRLEALFVRAEHTGGPVGLARMWRGLAEASTTAIQESDRELRRRWSGLLPFDAGESEVRFDSEALKTGVAAQFPVSPATSTLARFHSPDLMIAAENVNDINRGKFLFVLGEVHAHGNTLLQPVQLGPNPRAGELVRQFEADREGNRQLFLVINHNHGGTRVAPDSMASYDLHLLRDSSPSWRPAEQVYTMGELFLARSHSGLRVRALNRPLDLPVSALFRNFFVARCPFGFFPPLPYVPRVAIDNLVIHRRTWEFGLEDWETPGDSQARYLHLCRRRRRAGLPRRVFMRVPGEIKPQYVDFHSPVSVLCMARLINGALKDASARAFKGVTGLTLSEMLPEPDQCWLPDADGAIYTSELRVAVVDDAPAKGFF